MKLISDEDVVNIRYARADGDSVAVLAEKYHVTVTTIHKIIRGLRRKELGGPIEPRNPGWPHRQPASQVLTDHDVVVIRLKAQRGARGMDLATEYGVTRSCIADIVNGRTRRSLPGPVVGRGHLTREQVRDVRERYAAGTRRTVLAEEYGVNPATISNIIRGRTRRDAPGPITPRKGTN